MINQVVVSKIFYFHPYLGKISNLTIIFFNWVVQPPTRMFFILNMSMYIFCGEFSPENATENSFNSVMSFSSKLLPPSPFFEPDFGGYHHLRKHPCDASFFQPLFSFKVITFYPQQPHAFPKSHRFTTGP